ncbi:Spx/MgsR family RNA polymerase-binding regulatory protein [bacterium]|jgi:arsenate reductase (glutaredoxin)|nr:Spx/MgsR family RNA polymerase-binding regulatory protein [bacterium]
MKLYIYKNCGTCRKAKAFLIRKGIDFEEIPIREIPPSKDELLMMIQKYEGNWKPLFNTSGMDYRALKVKDMELNKDLAVDLLGSNGNLVKRPFVVDGDRSRVGFNEKDWSLIF